MSASIGNAATAIMKRRGDLPWAAGGWIFFVAENAILSENRTWLIAELGDDRYHLVYGTLSTIATASIGYSFVRLRRQHKIPESTLRLVPRSPMVFGGAWVVLTLGLTMATQGLPKFQIPVGMSSEQKLQVRCPFDFKEPPRPDHSLYGMERVTRHPGLWSLGLAGLGQALLIPPAALPLKIWWCGPALVAWLGGAHTDSRFRRNMGGTLDPMMDAQTSNIPFGAMMMGQQGNPATSFQNLVTEELKPLNAVMAAAASTVWVVLQARRFRIR
ncbi:RCE1 homolog, prenyl protein protease (Saccharomyces cerevisiae) [Seminavis robusta]|uniref:RCE1 homolog, prenyl protein protease (Saccharomyces cerevisiae) n=1 Tax=Seminavis robusta TaxID=568900 RepID=A0A9N8EW87_9STRA|nr:RCE1 homolog, prenyl protein protease (Saccharomyces cerevisiae) [Seminavis robusta]|eukprot:Sro1873_g302930.1 RCE1 homolog, prenyl protein protease (Saccharomyces cerevisiae) (272) ;mRNA; r:16868-17683